MVDVATGDVLWEIESQPDDIFKDPNSYPGQIIVRYGYLNLSPSGNKVILYFEWDADERGVFLADGNTGEFIRKFDISPKTTRQILNGDQYLLVYPYLSPLYVDIYNLLTGELIHKFSNASSAKLTIEGSYLYVYYPDEMAIRVYDIENFEMGKKFDELNGISGDLHLTPHGDRILYDEGYMTIGRLDYNSEKDSGVITKLQTLIESIFDIDAPSHQYTNFGKGISEDGKYAYLIIRETNTIWLWDLEELGLSGVKQGDEYR